MRNAVTSVLLLCVFLVPAFAGSAHIGGYLLLLALLGGPIALLAFARRLAAPKWLKRAIVALVVLFVVLDLPLFFGAGFAAPVVGLLQVAVAVAIVAAIWFTRRGAA